MPTPNGKPSKRGRPRGAIDKVLKGREFGLDHFAAVKAYLYGLDPLMASKRYLLADEAPSSTEAALRQLGDLMLLIADRGRSRRHGPESPESTSFLRAADTLEKTGKACLALIQEINVERKNQKNAQRLGLEKEADQRGLKYVPKGKLPSPPPRFATMRAFDDWYEDTYRPDDLLDKVELAAKYQEHLSDWYESQGFYVPPDYGQSQHQFTEQVKVSATQMDDSPRVKSIDPALRSLAGKQIDALKWTVQQQPAAADHLKAWIGGTTLEALTKSDIFTLFSLGEMISQYGPNWWKEVPGLGPVRAERLHDWLLEVKVPGLRVSVENFESIQYRRLREVKVYRESKGTPPALSELRLEPLVPYLEDDDLNGTNGIFRKPGPNMLLANNDIDAVVEALSKYKDKVETLKVYAREICRFCLWSYRIKKTAISSIGVGDAREYKEFLSNIPTDWISTHKDAPPRGSSDWRPFRGPLDEASKRKALTSINVIFAQLMEGGYTTGNPMAGVLKKSGLPKPAMDVQRSFSSEKWNVICTVMDGAAPSPSSRRTKALVHLLSSTGIRRDELYKARLSHVEKLNVDGENAYLLTVTGKGSKTRQAVIPNDVMKLVESHLADRPDHFKDDLSTKEGRAKIPLISVLNDTVNSFQLTTPPDPGAESKIVMQARELASESGALSPDGMSAALKRLLNKCIVEAANQNIDVDEFQNATLHWMRHTFGHTMADAGVDLRLIQKAMGHSNINTTAQYSKAELKQMVRGLRTGHGAASPTPVVRVAQVDTDQLE